MAARRPSHLDDYLVGYGPHAHRHHQARTAADRAAFLLPHLRPGMRLLDCGCGPGSITCGLAQAIAPGDAIGLDLSPSQVARARALAAALGVTNLHVLVGDAYRLPFADASFDVVFAHNVLEHLRDPLAALREMRRVLRPGGLVAIRDPDYGSLIWAPSTPLLDKASRLLLRLRELAGSPYYARNQRAMLSEAGFVHIEAFAFVEYQAAEEATQAFADLLIEVLGAPTTRAALLAHGWADGPTINAMLAEVRAWGTRPDAFRALTDCAAIGRVPAP